ncbi:MAG: flagellar hook-associated protein FlgL [Burkholderiales bacterium]|nr:flagellar hook-associated protein FlgL [Burkholderiales bacterium]
MRITAANAFDTSIRNLQRRQQEMTEAQERLTSGKRVIRSSDDPAAAARAERAMAAINRAEADQRALDTSRSAMQQAESALGDAGELLQQVRERVMQAGNGSFSDAERANLADSIRGLRNDLLALANRDDGAGRYLFGGQGADQPPLVDGIGGVSYVAAAGELYTASGEATPLTVDGRAAWLQAPDPGTPGATLSVFDVLDRIAGELATPGRDTTVIAQGVRDGLGDIDALSENLSRWRSRTGESLRRADDIEQRLAQGKLDAQEERSASEDLDMVAAISDFQARQSGYDAALQSYSIVQKMSLFDYLR